MKYLAKIIDWLLTALIALVSSKVIVNNSELKMINARLIRKTLLYNFIFL